MKREVSIEQYNVLRAEDQRKILEKYRHLATAPLEKIPKKHRHFGGGLRCFFKMRTIDKTNNIVYPYPELVRCGSVASEGSLYCNFHGGGNMRRSIVKSDKKSYKPAFRGLLGSYFAAFLSDPTCNDMKPELSILRTTLKNYINKLNSRKVSNSKKIVEMIAVIAEDDALTSNDKFLAIKDIVDSQSSITDGQAIDRIGRCVDNIGKTIERINKIESRGDFILTPDGLKLLLRGVITVIAEIVSNKQEIELIKSRLTQLTVESQGDFSSYKDYAGKTPIGIEDAHIIGEGDEKS